MFLTASIDAHEGREMAIVDMPGAFMQVGMDVETYEKQIGKLVDILLGIDKEIYAEYVTIENWTNGGVPGTNKGTLHHPNRVPVMGDAEQETNRVGL
jgi:hypothetical protein